MMNDLSCFQNFRDFGGISVIGGRIKKGMLFRSDAPKNLTIQDEKILYRMGIRYIVDFRSKEECQADPYRIISTIRYFHQSALPAKNGLQSFYFFQLLRPSSTKEEVFQAASFIREGYKILPFHNPAYRLIFSLMQEKEGGILFHCSSGKDRTGVMAALLLKILGADDSVIYRDYMESNQNILPAINAALDSFGFQRETKEHIRYVCSVHEELLQESFAEIRKHYVDFMEYLRIEYGLDIKQLHALKEKYIEQI